jgi:hypothetical protein
MTIGEREESLKRLLLEAAEKLGPEAKEWLSPPGFEPWVQLRAAGRKKRSTAREDYWHPADGEILIYFAPKAASAQELAPEAWSPSPAPGTDHNHNHDGNNDGIGNRIAPAFKSPAPVPVHRGQLPVPVPAEVCEMLEELARAEKRPMAFLGLIWFRDTWLLADKFSWFDRRMEVIGWALDNGLIDKGEAPNPRNPNWPTTTIKLSAKGRAVLDKISRERR